MIYIYFINIFECKLLVVKIHMYHTCSCFYWLYHS